MPVDERNKLEGAIEGGFSPQFMEKIVRAKLGMCTGKAGQRHVDRLNAYLSRAREVSKMESELSSSVKLGTSRSDTGTN